MSQGASSDRGEVVGGCRGWGFKGSCLVVKVESEVDVGRCGGDGGASLDGCERTPPCLCIEMEGCYQSRWFSA